MVRLQRAAAVSHRRGQIVEAVRVDAAVLLAIAGIAVTLVGQGRSAMPIIGAGWFVLSTFLLKRQASAATRQSALLREMFDTTLFHIPWRATVAGDPVGQPDISRLARGLARGSATDRQITNGWYDSTAGVHHPYDILITQEQNLGWDARLRRRYVAFVLSAAVGWSVIGLVAGMLIGHATIADILLGFFVPSLAAYQIAVDIVAGQQRAVAERERLNRIVTEELRRARPGPVSDTEWRRVRGLARDVQDGILRTRMDANHLPEWFYRRYQQHDERDFADTAQAHRHRLAAK